jgi:hypothetical protein
MDNIGNNYMNDNGVLVNIALDNIRPRACNRARIRSRKTIEIFFFFL